MLTLNQILSELEEKTDFSREQLEEKIKKKQGELSGLVSMEGAGHLVARDLGVDLLKLKKRPLKIGNITSGMRNINLKARIIDISDIRNFERKDGSKGKVCNLVLIDDTGQTRLPLWDKQVGIIDNNFLATGDVVEIKNAVARENIFGNVEILLLKGSEIQKIENDTTLPTEPTQMTRSLKRTPLRDVQEGFFEVKASVVDIFNTGPVFHVCPECKTKLEQTGDGYVCGEHGKVEPQLRMIVSGIIDDGTSNMRAVFFGDQAKELTDLDAKLLADLSQDEALDMIKEKVLGNEFLLQGRVRKNKIFDSLELVVNEVEEIDIEKESKRLIDEIESF